jgi:hypothetical protein
MCSLLQVPEDTEFVAHAVDLNVNRNKNITDLNQWNELAVQLVHFVLSIVPEKFCSRRHDLLEKM